MKVECAECGFKCNKNELSQIEVDDERYGKVKRKVCPECGNDKFNVSK